MKVLLAGASGAIGRHLVPQLIDAKHEVIGITRTSGSLDGMGAREVVVDVLDRSALLAALEGITADAVVHQATSLKRPPTTRRAMRQTNRLRAEGTSALIAAARMVGARKFVAASFFGGYGLFDHGREPLGESAPFGEIDASADSVQLALLSLEQQVHAFGGMSLRFGLFYDSTTTSVSPVSRTWDGLLPMLHVSDAAAATVRALTRYKAGAIYNVADDSPMSYRDREIARASAANLRPPMRLSDSVIRLVAPFGALLLTRASITLSTERAATDLGWKPHFRSLRECLAADAPADRVVTPRATPTPLPEPPSVPEPGPTPPVPDDSKNRSAVPVGSEEPVPHPKSSHPRTKPSPSVESADPFADMDSAIARIGEAPDD